MIKEKPKSKKADANLTLSATGENDFKLSAKDIESYPAHETDVEAVKTYATGNLQTIIGKVKEL